MSEEILQASGDVLIEKITIVSAIRGKYLDVLDYLVEVNLYESIFSPTLTGSLTLSDSRNLIRDFPILGEELLVLQVRTPTLDKELAISKTFRIHGIRDKKFARDGTTQLYTLSFCSVELFADLHNPLYKGFEGKPEEVVTKIFNDYLKSPRNLTVDKTSDDTTTLLNILGKTDNTIKFVSPGWTPIQCINWIASKSLSENNTAANFLFWETSKGFYFGNLHNVLQNSQMVNIGEYFYSESFVNTLNMGEGTYDTTDAAGRKMFGVKSLYVEEGFDQLRNNMSGYISNRLLDVNLYNKNYVIKDYDHGTSFKNYAHTEKGKVVPMFAESTTRNPLVYLKVNYSYPKLYGTDNNFDVVTKDIFGNRRSNLIELNNYSMTIVIPGRTDIEVGSTIGINLPKGKPLQADDASTPGLDELYSGKYLITSITHTINRKTHFATMNINKDCFLEEAINKLDT